MFILQTLRVVKEKDLWSLHKFIRGNNLCEYCRPCTFTWTGVNHLSLHKFFFFLIN